MKNVIFNIALAAAAMTSLVACSDDDPVLAQRDWDGDSFYFASSDLTKQDIYYKPAVGYVGDPMPFYDPVEKDFKILYLQDFRPNQAYTYHPIWCLSTSDAASYTSLGEIISCGTANEIDAAIGTGSTIYENGTYYTFYTGHSADASQTAGFGEAIKVATSTDFRNWEKNRSLLITGGDTYSTSDFRDPFVFKGDDSQYHMLVSTKLNGKGVLAEFISSDLLNWRDNGVFMYMMWDRFYECPDLFKMGDWWYLIYSEQHDAIRKVQYFKGRTLDELKACTANDAGLWPDSHEGFLDSRGLYAGKTASNGTDRYIWGWCATRAGDSNTSSNDWGGNLVAHKLVQHNDGTLTLSEVPALANKFSNTTAGESFSLSGDSYKLLNRLAYTNRISFTVKLGNATDKFGISLARGNDSSKYYTLVVNPEGDTNRKINFEEEGTDGSGFISNADSYVFQAPSDGVYNITMVTDNSVVTLYINDVLAYTNRVYGAARNCWSINCYGGSLQVSNLTTATN
jgi:beta-fructofuranosidase